MVHVEERLYTTVIVCFNVITLKCIVFIPQLPANCVFKGE